MTESAGKERVLYLDALRALASFLVIVNHTNSHVFQASSPESPTWFVSIAWYYLSKIAVPLFVMISGALLLPRVDSYRRVGRRVLRMLGALVVFSYVYYLAGVWNSGWSWGRALDIPGFLVSVWQTRVTDSFWYLYFYIGLLFMLPLLQRLAKGMNRNDLLYLMSIVFAVNALFPLLSHLAPGLALPEYVNVSVFNVFIGLFFAGHFIHAYLEPKPWHAWAAACGATLSVGVSVWLTALNYQAQPGGKYWFMDERTAPSLTIILCAFGAMWLAKCVSARRKVSASPFTRLVSTLGRCAFGVYLAQDLIIAETRYRLFEPWRAVMWPFLAVLIWEVLVYGAALLMSWVLSRIPGLRKLMV